MLNVILDLGRSMIVMAMAASGLGLGAIVVASFFGSKPVERLWPTFLPPGGSAIAADLTSQTVARRLFSSCILIFIGGAAAMVGVGKALWPDSEPPQHLTHDVSLLSMGWLQFWPLALVSVAVVVIFSSHGLRASQIAVLSLFGFLASVTAAIGVWYRLGREATICFVLFVGLAIVFNRLQAAWKPSNDRSGSNPESSPSKTRP